MIENRKFKRFNAKLLKLHKKKITRNMIPNMQIISKDCGNTTKPLTGRQRLFLMAIPSWLEQQGPLNPLSIILICQ